VPTEPILFPFSQYWAIFAGFVGVVLILLALDLGILNRKAKEMPPATAAKWTAFWIGLALAFNLVFWIWARSELAKPEFGPILEGTRWSSPVAAADDLAREFLTGYIVEISLSVDNLFVFLVLFSYFKVPAHLRHRVLFYGILGALICRGVFVALGTVLFQFHWLVVIFGAFLVLTGLKLLFSGDADGPDPSRNPVIRLLHRFLPVTEGYRGDRFIVREHGRRFATPLFVTLVALELTDIVFAVDSIPAIFGITREPLVVFTSNICAILGLRAMFFVLASAMDRFWMLKYGLGIVLVFVGLKMTVLERFFEGGKFPTSWSLAIIAGTIGVTLIGSLMMPRRGGAKETERDADGDSSA
jgi:tellurite resistance protein TerC